MKEQTFSESELSERRVLIAQDVLAQLDAKKFVAANVGVYVERYHNGIKRPLTRSLRPEDQSGLEKAGFGRCNDGDQVKDVMMGQSCLVCARGALFVAKVFRFNALQVWELPFLGGKEMQNYVSEFDEQQQTSIENAYEGIEFILDNYKDEDAQVEAQEPADYMTAQHLAEAEWKRKFPGSHERMQEIMRNIVRNSGMFDATDIAHLPWESA